MNKTQGAKRKVQSAEGKKAVMARDLEAAYRQMAREEAREAEALEWAEATAGDVADETRCVTLADPTVVAKLKEQ